MNMYCKVLSASVTFREQPFARPLQLSSGTITEITEATVEARVAIGGREATGRGSIYLSDLWAWPDPSLPHAARDAEMRGYLQTFLASLGSRGLKGAHPLVPGMDLLEAAHARDACPVPLLARLVCLSPLDAALHDAAGRALGVSAFRLYETDTPLPELDGLFPGTGALAAVRGFLLRRPVPRVDGWYVVSGTDPLDGDFREFVSHRGFRAFKLKTHGKDPEADARRTVEVYRTALALGVLAPRLSADSNEGNPDAASVLAYLDTLQRMDAAAYDALEYLEQPTGRDIITHVHDWHEAGARKPVLVDEGLTGLDVLPHVAAQGWSGICLKTCKGHSLNLVAGAWAHARGMKIAVQDLTNPGLSALHSCLLAQHVPSLNGVELNSPQFTPAANEPWLERQPGLFAPRDGTHQVTDAMAAGLGSGL